MPHVCADVGCASRVRRLRVRRYLLLPLVSVRATGTAVAARSRSLVMLQTCRELGLSHSTSFRGTDGLATLRQATSGQRPIGLASTSGSSPLLAFAKKEGRS